MWRDFLTWLSYICKAISGGEATVWCQVSSPAAFLQPRRGRACGSLGPFARHFRLHVKYPRARPLGSSFQGNHNNFEVNVCVCVIKDRFPSLLRVLLVLLNSTLQLGRNYWGALSLGMTVWINAWNGVQDQSLNQKCLCFHAGWQKVKDSWQKSASGHCCGFSQTSAWNLRLVFSHCSIPNTGQATPCPSLSHALLAATRRWREHEATACPVLCGTSREEKKMVLFRPIPRPRGRTTFSWRKGRSGQAILPNFLDRHFSRFSLGSCASVFSQCLSAPCR